MEKYEEFQKVNDQNLINNLKDNVLVNNVCVITQKYTILEPINLLMAYRLSELNFLFVVKVANIRCFILIAVEIFHNIIRK